MSTLEEVLSGEEVVEPETTEETTETTEPEEAEVVEAETEEVTEEPSEPEGVTEEAQAEPEAEPPSAKEVPLIALLDERDKRKQSQAELAELKKQLEEKKEVPDFWENPQEAVEQLVTERTSKLEEQFTSGYLNLSMQYSKNFHEDFDPALEAFTKAAGENPALVTAAIQSEMPGEFIYKAGKEYMTLSEYGDVGTAIERAKRDAVQDYIAQQAEKDVTTKEKLAAVPKPITEESNASSPAAKVEGVDTPLENIFPNQR